MDKLITYLKYMFLGLIQGITEILPVSSSGNLMVFQEILNLQQPGLVFELFTNMASFIALILIFYKDIWKLIKGSFLYIFNKNSRQQHLNDFTYSLKLLVSVIPIGIIGLLIKNHIPNITNLLTVGISLIVTGTLLLIVYLTRNLYETHVDITWRDTFFISLSQPIAVLPGISRSGTTIIAGKTSRLSLQSILKFSFLSYIIISIPTSILGVYDLTQVSEQINWTSYILAFIVTFGATFITGKLILKKLKVDHLIYFSIYCLIIAVTALTLYFV